ncbi:MAG: DUF6095 family protein [Flavobacteriales bacterium]|jgi:hypothetical protein
MDLLEVYYNLLMSEIDKNKIIKGAMWLSLTALVIALDASMLFIGFNNMRKDSYTVIIIAITLLPVLFFCAYKGLKNVLDAIFS